MNIKTKCGSWLVGAALGLAAVAPAHADLVTFDNVDPNIFAIGEHFNSGGFRFEQASVYDSGLGFGVVDDPSAFLYGVAPTNADSQFYAGLNDGGVTMKKPGTNRAFYIDGFQFSFVPALTGIYAEGEAPGYLVAMFTTLAGDESLEFFEFSAADANGAFAFSTLGLADLGGLAQSLRSVTFFACMMFDGQCYYPAGNEAQFALDNIYATAVPEPGTLGLALLGLGLMAGVARRRRSN